MAEIKVEDVAQDKVREETVPEDGAAAEDQAEDVWDEERLESAMDTLKEMYIQVSAPFHSVILFTHTFLVTGAADKHPEAGCSPDRQAAVSSVIPFFTPRRLARHAFTDHSYSRGTLQEICCCFFNCE
jgi:hypothetical protein